MEIELNYEGRRWPAVEVKQVGEWGRNPDLGCDMRERQRKDSPLRLVPRPPIFGLSVAGRNKGRAWRPTLAAPWARFATLDLSDAEQIRRFVARYGDPFNLLPSKRDHALATGIPAESSTVDWPRLRRRLAVALTAWGEADATTVRPIVPAQLPHASRFLLGPESVFEHATWAEIVEIGLVGEPAADGRLILSARNLGAYMVADANDMLQRRIPLRSCAHCGDPMRLTRTDARFCSQSCRALYAQSQTRKEP